MRIRLAGVRRSYCRIWTGTLRTIHLDRWATCEVGLGVAGAFDSAPLVAPARAFVEYGAPAVLRRFIGDWLVMRSFRIEPGSPGGIAWGSSMWRIVIDTLDFTYK